MRQNYLQKQFYHLARKSIPKPRDEAKHRQKHIQAWEALRETFLEKAADIVEAQEGDKSKGSEEQIA